MKITSKQINQAMVISINGSIDALTANEVSEFFMRQISNDHNQLVADLNHVDFMSSAGLRALLASLKESRHQGGDLRLAAPQPGVEKILKISGFISILKAFPSVNEAVTSFNSKR